MDARSQYQRAMLVAAFAGVRSQVFEKLREHDEAEVRAKAIRLEDEYEHTGPLTAYELGRYGHGHTPEEQRAGRRKPTKAEKKAAKRGRRS